MNKQARPYWISAFIAAAGITTSGILLNYIREESAWMIVVGLTFWMLVIVALICTPWAIVLEAKEIRKELRGEKKKGKRITTPMKF